MIDKKTKILNSAIELFVRNGFDRVSTAEISRNASVATGTMFYHFKTKEDIIITAYKRIKKSIIEQTAIKENLVISPREELKSLWKNLIHWGLEHKAEVQYLLQFKNSPYYCDNLMAEDDTWKARKSWWEEGIKQKKFKQVPLDFLLSTFNTLLFGTIEYLMRDNKNSSEYIDFSFEMCWDSIKLDS
ncbi:MAG: TetR/AcrR family transcriptional regulator [Leeuwenhoekiella sp.]